MLGTRDAYFWATHGGAELDLLVRLKGKRYGFEFKDADAPGRTRPMKIALSDLRLSRLWVVFSGAEEYALDESMSVISLSAIPRLTDELRRS